MPERADLFASIESAFEDTHPDIDVRMIDLHRNYYDDAKPDAITNTEADVMELDSVFIDDFVDRRIQSLPASLVPASGALLNVAESAARAGGVWYGVPHWVCTYFVFSSRGPGRDGLLVDLKGKLALGELYAHAVIDEHGSPEASEKFLDPSNIEDRAVTALKRTRARCEPDLCRDVEYHAMDGFYARQFARKGGRALIAYAEGLYYVGQERANGCRKDNSDCRSIENIDAVPLSLAGRSSTPLVWVDMLTISKECTGQCLSDAVDFIRFVSDRAQVEKSLFSTSTTLPRYLLPALQFFYNDAGFLSRMPLYSRFRVALDKAVVLRGSNLNSRLKAIGKELDERRLGK